MPIPGNYGEVMAPPRANFNSAPTGYYTPPAPAASNQQMMMQNRPAPSGGTLQQYFRQVTPVNGYVVKDISEVMPRDVPMDGSVSIFPAEDYSCIWARMWNKDGQLLTFKFIEDVPAPPVVNGDNPQANGYLSEIMNRLNNMQTVLDAISSSFDIHTDGSNGNKNKEEAK